MAELTKEYFEKHLDTQLGKLVTNGDFDRKLETLVTKTGFEQTLNQTLDQRLQVQTVDLKTHMDEKTEELAHMVKEGFDGVDTQLTVIVQMLDVRKDVDDLKQQMFEIRHSLKLDD